MKKCPYCAEEILDEAIKCKHCGSWLAPPPGPFRPPEWMRAGSGKQLRRSATDRMIAGVCGGIGKLVGIDPTVVRIVYAVATVFTAIVPGVIIYVALALIIPRENDV